MNWKQAETVVAELYGGHVQPGSGCSRNIHKKQDAVSDTHLVEVKYTKANSYRANGDLFLAIRQRAARIGLIPAFAVVFDRGSFSVVWHVDIEAVYPLKEGTKTLLVKWEEMRDPWKMEYA